MEGGEPRPQLLELIPNRMEWTVRDRGGGGVGNNGYPAAVVEQQLELRLGPPGGGNDEGFPSSAAAGGGGKEKKVVEEPCSLLSLGLFPRSSGNPSAGAKRGFLDTLEDAKLQAYPPQKAGFFGAGGASKEEAAAAAAHKATTATDGGSAAEQQQVLHRSKAPAASTPASANAAAAAANKRSQASRPSQPPVVGWPPIRSFRKNIAAASSSKPSSSSSSPQNAEKKHLDKCGIGTSTSNKSMLVKINMDGVPIGRKVDLGACCGYDRLSAAVDQLFRGLLAAQSVLKDHGGSASSTAQAQGQEQGTPAITCLLDGSGEYTLVYEDNEGDRMLVGDVPWEMFVSTVKRLRVLRSSELPSLSLGVGAATRSKKLPSPAAER